MRHTILVYSYEYTREERVIHSIIYISHSLSLSLSDEHFQTTRPVLLLLRIHCAHPTGKLRAAPHRVVMPPGRKQRERFSIAHFFSSNKASLYIYLIYSLSLSLSLSLIYVTPHHNTTQNIQNEKLYDVTDPHKKTPYSEMS